MIDSQGKFVNFFDIQHFGSPWHIRALLYAWLADILTMKMRIEHTTVVFVKMTFWFFLNLTKNPTPILKGATRPSEIFDYANSIRRLERCWGWWLPGGLPLLANWEAGRRPCAYPDSGKPVWCSREGSGCFCSKHYAERPPGVAGRPGCLLEELSTLVQSAAE